MNYTKPQVVVLGQAVSVIQSHVKFPVGTYDGIPPMFFENAAYDLDE
jgi:hypothetical protein